MSIRVQCDLSAEQYRTLRHVAESQDFKSVGEFIQHLLAQAAHPSKRKYRRWTPAQLAKLQQVYSETGSVPASARALGMPYFTAYDHLRRDRTTKGAQR